MGVVDIWFAIADADMVWIWVTDMVVVALVINIYDQSNKK